MGRRTRAATHTRQSPEGRRRARARGWQKAGEGAKFGALVGSLFAVLALLVGLGRLALAWIGEGSVQGPDSWQDARALIAYVLVLVVGGAVVGAIHSAVGSRLMTAVTFMAAGAVLMNTIALTNGGIESYDRVESLWMTAVGCGFGLAAAYGAARKA